MTVPKYERDTAPAEFVRNAAKLEAFTAVMCGRLPKNQSFTRSRYLTDCANGILAHAVQGNKIWVNNAEDAKQRLEHFNEAYSLCAVLAAKVDQLQQEDPTFVVSKTDHRTGEIYEEIKHRIPKGKFVEWTVLITQQMKLLHGIIRADRKRFNRKFTDHKFSSRPPRVRTRRIRHRRSGH